MKDLNMMYEWAMDIVTKCGISTGTITSVTINTRAKKRWGQCKLNGNGTYSININVDILDDDVPYKPVLETIIHEILHTCKGCFNHGNEWKRLARIVKEETGYNITRCASASNFGIEKPIREKKHNYVFVCEDCGQIIVREKASKFVRNYHAWRCGKCGGNFRFDSENSNCQILTARPKRYSYIEQR